MLHPYADLRYDQGQNFRDPFKFYFKNKAQNKHNNQHHHLEQLVRPRLRIAIVTETWPPEINGVALSLLQLCRGLQKLGHKILLIRPQQKSLYPEFTPYQECLVKAQNIPKYNTLQFGWPQYAKVNQAVERFMPDVIHIVTEGPLGLTALQVAKRRAIPVSSGFHSPFQDFSRFFDLAFLLKPIQRYLRWFHNSTQLTCVPSVDTEKALREFGVNCRLVVVGRGVDTARFSAEHRRQSLRQQWGADDETTVLLSVGRLSPEKEIDLIIDTFYTLQQQQKKVKLVIVGDGPDLKRLQRLSHSHRLAYNNLAYENENRIEPQVEHQIAAKIAVNNEKYDANTTEYKAVSDHLSEQADVIFTGSLRGQALAEAYASADVFVFASQVETFGNVVLEAMASGLPIVAFDYACAQQYVLDQETGWLSPKGNKPAFINRILQLPKREKLQQMGARAQQATQNVGWQRPVEQLELALYQVAQQSVFVT